MSRDAGFDRMDVSTSIAEDPKFRALVRRAPDLFAVGFTAYFGLLASSWRSGDRLTMEEGWPLLIPIDTRVIEALQGVGLVDDGTRIPQHAWESWFVVADERRRLGRERQRRADVRRGRIAAPDSVPSVSPSVQTDRPSVSQSGPSLDPRRSIVGPEIKPTVEDDQRTTCLKCGDGPLSDRDDNVVVRNPLGQLGHRECPTLASP